MRKKVAMLKVRLLERNHLFFLQYKRESRERRGDDNQFETCCCVVSESGKESCEAMLIISRKVRVAHNSAKLHGSSLSLNLFLLHLIVVVPYLSSVAS